MEKEKPLDKAKLKILEKYSSKELHGLADLKLEKELETIRSLDGYKLVLAYANEFLDRAGFDKVATLEEFHSVDRKALLKIDGDKLVEDMLPKILKIYKKKDIDYSRRKERKNYNLSVLRYLLLKINYKLNWKDMGPNGKMRHALNISRNATF